MNCRERQEFFSDLYDGNVPSDRRRDLESHLSACAECRTEYDHFTSSLHALREGAVPAPGDAFVRRVVESAREESERQALFQNTGLRRPTTRRTVAPRRGVWAVPTVAAAALIAFALGLLVQKQAADREIRELQEQISRAENRTIPRTIDPYPPQLNNQKIIEQFCKEQNLVQVDGLWMSADVRDRLNRGEMKVGDQWVDANKEIERLKKELAENLPSDVDPKDLEARVLEKHGLVKRGDWIIPKAWADAFDQGHVLDGSGQPKDLAAIVNEKVAELKLVQHEGRWMSAEQKQELLASRLIRKDAAAPATAVTRAFDGVEIGPPLGFRTLLLYPLLVPADRAMTVAGFAESFAADKIEITEVDALQVRLRNKGDADVAVLAGEVLYGGRHARVVARDSIVPAKKDRTIDVFDVEPAELRASGNFRKDAGHSWAPLGMRRLLHEDAGQAALWASLAASGSKGSIADLYKDHKAALAEFRSALADLKAAHPRMAGVAVAVGDSIASLELYGSPAIFGAHFERILESVSMEAVLQAPRRPTDLPPGALSVRRLAESVFSADAQVDGDSVALRRNGRLIGRALVPNGDAVRVCLFPDAPPPPRPPIDLAVAPAKVQHVIKALEAQLQGGRRAALRELALMPGPGRDAILKHAQPGSPYRKEAIDAIGLRGDPSAANQLLKWLEDSRKDKTTEIYAALAQALVRIGSEEAIQTLIGHIDPRAPVSKTAAESAALLMRRADVNVVESSMGALISALNRMPSESGTDPQGPWPLKTLRQVTGKSFVGTTDYAIWWNDAANREAWKNERNSLK